MMAVIKEDKFGVFVAAGGYKARPASSTGFKVGDKVQTRHFGGSPIAGVGKDSSCKRGEYLEEWITCGMQISGLSDEIIADQILWYKHAANLVKPSLGLEFSKDEMSRISSFIQRLSGILKKGGDS